MLIQTRVAFAWIDFNGYMGHFVIVGQKRFIVAGRFGIMGDNGDYGRQMMGSHPPYVEIRYPVIRIRFDD